MATFKHHEGRIPLVIVLSQAGTDVPPRVLGRLADPDRVTAPADRHFGSLLEAARELGAHILEATVASAVIDLDRAPDAEEAARVGGLSDPCPQHDLTGRPLYLDEATVPPAEAADRITRLWRPFHQKLGDLVEALAKARGLCVVIDLCSVPAQAPILFGGELPDLNLATNDGATAAVDLAEALLAAAAPFGPTTVLDGCLKGGYLVREHGKPALGVHAVQLAISQPLFLAPDGRSVDADGLARLQPIVDAVIGRAAAWLADARLPAAVPPAVIVPLSVVRTERG